MALRSSHPQLKPDHIGTVMTRLAAGALALNLLAVAGLIVLVASHGLAHFWQGELVELKLYDGTRVLGQIRDRVAARSGEGAFRVRLEVGNRDLTGQDFRWIDEPQVLERSLPREALLLERREWGNFYGHPVELRRGDERLASGAQTLPALRELHARKLRDHAASQSLERDEIGAINAALERRQLRLRGLELRYGEGAATRPEAAQIQREIETLHRDYEARIEELDQRKRELLAETLVMRSADARDKEIPVAQIVRIVEPNTLGATGKLALYASRVWEFLSGDPRESNTEGGIFPAIFGTVLMVFLTSLAVAPLGVLAALYLREYAREGLFVRMVRIAVNSLAGVPSIVFGVFGLGFFVYLVGGSIDALFYPERLPAPTFGTGGILWASLTLALLTVPVVVVSTEEGLSAVPRVVREGSLALGATKWETLRRIVLPASLPGILTGLILAMARAAGEVAPLMIVGMVKLAPSLPLDAQFPFVHFERKFMHLGFHIYDVGFQSPNVEAVQPLVFATALLLILVVLATNLTAIMLRNHLRRRYATSAV